MDVLDSPLNLAHKYGRRAEAHTIAGRIEKAIECHNRAVVCLSEALSASAAPKAIESLHLQRDWHKRQSELLRCASPPSSADDIYQILNDCDPLVALMPEAPSSDHDSKLVAELTSQNNALRGHIGTLLAELAKQRDDSAVYRTENERLRQRLSDRHKTTDRGCVHVCHDSVGGHDGRGDAMVFPLELPPLEMPEFDFGSLTPRSTL